MTTQLTDRARVVMVEAGRIAKKLGHNFIGTEHLLLALSITSPSVATQVFEDTVGPDYAERIKAETLGILGIDFKEL